MDGDTYEEIKELVDPNLLVGFLHVQYMKSLQNNYQLFNRWKLAAGETPSIKPVY